MSDTPMQVPLVEQLESVPEECHEMIEVGPFHHRNIPYGRFCHEAAAMIRQLIETLRGIADMPEFDQDDAHRLRHKAKVALAAKGVQPAAQEGAYFTSRNGELVAKDADGFDVDPAERRLLAEVCDILRCPHDAEALLDAAKKAAQGQDCPLALTQASVEELQRQLAESQEQLEQVKYFEKKIFEQLQDANEKLESAQAACKAKDEALSQAQQGIIRWLITFAPHVDKSWVEGMMDAGRIKQDGCGFFVPIPETQA